MQLPQLQARRDTRRIETSRFNLIPGMPDLKALRCVIASGRAEELRGRLHSLGVRKGC